MPFTLLIGGARSGKTAIAERMASAGDEAVLYLATGEPFDAEMAERIQRHRTDRSPDWTTIEEPRELVTAVRDADPSACIVLDCLTLWVSNRLSDPDEMIEGEARAVAEVLASRSGPAIVVSNEVGSGIVPIEPSVRRYRDLLGRVNSAFRLAADASYLCVAGGVVPIVEAPS